MPWGESMGKPEKEHDTIKISVPIPKKLHTEFIAAAKANDRSGAAAVRDLMREYIERTKEKGTSLF